MRNFFFIFLLSVSYLYADSLTNLLTQYEETSDKSLQTVDEKLGHVVIYSQKEIQRMQYHRLSDILKEISHMNLNRNNYGLTNLSLTGTKTSVSGFFRLFINDHEVSSMQTQSFALSWGELPLDFVDHVEIYSGDSSFALGNETGVYFIRVYTKSALKENSTELTSVFSSQDSYSQSITHSEVLENGWSYLLFFNQSKISNENSYKGEILQNDSDQRYFYIDAKNETTNINIAYTDINKDNFMGFSKDVVPNSGELLSENYFIDLKKYFLDDRSLRIGASYNVYNRTYNENNDEGLLIPNPSNEKTFVSIFSGDNTSVQIEEDLKFTKMTTYITKEFKNDNNHLISSFYIKNKTYDTKNRTSTNASNELTSNIKLNDFTEETVYSFLLEDDYQISDRLMIIGNAKYDIYDRDAYLENSKEQMYRIGAIYNPLNNFGIKGFYTKTYIPPTFFNTDLSSPINPDMKTQKYDIWTAEAAYTTTKSKFSIMYNRVEIEDFIYLLTDANYGGFINIDDKIRINGLAFNYEYDFSNGDSFDFNYYTSTSSQSINNSEKGGFFKYAGSFGKIDYFTLLIYRKNYEYKDVNVPNSYNVSLGATYNYSKDISFSLKGENLLDKSSQSLFYDSSTNTDFALQDYERLFIASLKLVF